MREQLPLFYCCFRIDLYFITIGLISEIGLLSENPTQSIKSKFRKKHRNGLNSSSRASIAASFSSFTPNDAIHSSLACRKLLAILNCSKYPLFALPVTQPSISEMVS